MALINLSPQGNFSVEFSNELAFSVLILISVLVLASLFIYHFYRSLSKKNLINLNLYKYNKADHPIMQKVLAMLLYLLEYILLIPVLLVIWLAGVSIFILLISSDSLGISYILWVSAGLVGAVRILAYLKKEISIDLAKLFPFITLSVVLLSAGKFNLGLLKENFLAIPSLLNHIFSFVVVVFFIEVFMRAIYTLYLFWVSEEGIIFDPRKENRVDIEE